MNVPTPDPATPKSRIASPLWCQISPRIVTDVWLDLPMPDETIAARIAAPAMNSNPSITASRPSLTLPGGINCSAAAPITGAPITSNASDWLRTIPSNTTTAAPPVRVAVNKRSLLRGNWRQRRAPSAIRNGTLTSSKVAM